MEKGDWLHQLAWFEIRVRLRTLAAGSLPRFLGPVLHGAFGHALDKLQNREPAARDLFRLCYGDPPGKREGYSSGVKPFLFSVPLSEGGAVSPDRSIEIRFVGSPILASNPAYLWTLFFAMQMMAQAGLGPDFVPFQVQEATLHPNPLFLPRYPTVDITPQFFRLDRLRHSREPIPSTVLLRLMTPLHITAKGEPMMEIDGPTFFRRLWERLAGWANVETDGSPRFESVQAENEKIHIWEVDRLSTRQMKRIEMDGPVGMVRLSGLDELTWKMLLLGERLHVGKKTTCGCGKYRLLNSQRARRDEPVGS